ncbi:helix-turn-helix transcriptional regulator [Romboutsia lituseburensis]|uniref:helix-turn-helix domain-containing protein n=1 Tax=Romboutsia lituseburensis TaxID=1537 RepID=UPI0028127D55|nr:helix-turn-helix transcriptional regulator [Romboutsia lituseburensis]
MKFNGKLLDLRKKNGLSQEELGRDLNVSRQTISKWDEGQSYADFKKIFVMYN